MKIIIDISERIKQSIDNNEGVPNCLLYELYKSIKESTPLSEHFGRPILEELAKEDLQVLTLAYVYATNLDMYGEDVTKAIYSATENAAMLEKAYRKGYYDAMNRINRMEKFDKNKEEGGTQHETDS